MIDLTPPGYVFAQAVAAAMFGLAVAVAPAEGHARRIGLVGAITLAEFVRWSWPFGGVPLATLAMGQAASPLAPVVRTLGSLLLVALTVVIGVALAAAIERSWRTVGVSIGVVIRASWSRRAGARHRRGARRRPAAHAGQPRKQPPRVWAARRSNTIDRPSRRPRGVARERREPASPVHRREQVTAVPLRRRCRGHARRARTHVAGHDHPRLVLRHR